MHFPASASCATFCITLALAASVAACSSSSSTRVRDDDAATAVDPDGGTAPRGPASITFWSAGREVTTLLYAEPFAVHVDGLTAHERVTVGARFWGYASWADFEADEAGSIDAGEDAPLEGTYEGADADGLVWSMIKESDLTGTTFDVSFSVERAGEVVAEATLARRPLDDGLSFEALRESGLVGSLFMPAGASSTPRPVIVVLGGSEGGLDTAEFLAAYYAGHTGFAALGLAYFGVDGLPDTLTDIPLEYFATALEWIASRSDLDATRVAVAGVSRGGELALQLGALHPELRAVIAEVPSGVRWGSAGFFDRAAWTLGGASLPYMPNAPDAEPSVETLPNGQTGYRLTPTFLASLEIATATERAAAEIDVEHGGAAFLLLGGGDDGLWPSCALAQIAMDRLHAAGHDAMHDDALVCYEDTGHFIGPPGWPTAETYAYRDSRIGGAWMVLGGTPAGTAHAQRAMYERVATFLADQLR